MVRNMKSLGLNMQRIVSRLQSNQNLLKLLYYTDKDPLSQPDLTQEQIKNEVYEKLIKIVPNVKIQDLAQSVIGLRVTDGFNNNENQEFRDIILDFEIFTPLVSWIIKDQNLRPFAIMGEIQESLNGKVIDGMGKLYCGDFNLSFVTNEVSGYIFHTRITEYD